MHGGGGGVEGGGSGQMLGLSLALEFFQQTGNAILNWLLNHNAYSSCSSTILYNIYVLACNSEAMSALCKACGKTLPVGDVEKHRLPGY